MSVQRKPVAFGDMRNWMKALKAAGEIREIDADIIGFQECWNAEALAEIFDRPALRGRRGMWALIGEAGQVLKRGHDLAPVLAPVERRLMKVVG